jgi:molybdopterin-guanine dinucleotide biosynthesis protein B
MPLSISARRLFGIAGFSGSGKTTLIEAVLPLLRARGLTVAVIKHTHHDFDIDQPGKDSHRFRAAGAVPVLLSSDHRSAMLIEHRDTPPTLAALLALLPPVDLVLVEGYKREAIPKLEVHREALCDRAGVVKPWLYPDDPHILAVASPDTPPTDIRRIDLNDLPQITDFILEYADSWPC